MLLVFLTNTFTCEHLAQVLCSLHWPLFRTDFKGLIFVFKALNYLVPPYLKDNDVIQSTLVGSPEVKTQTLR